MPQAHRGTGDEYRSKVSIGSKTRHLGSMAILMAVSFEAAGRSMAHTLGISGDWTANPDCYLAAATGVAEVLWTRAPQDARDPEMARFYIEIFMGRVAEHYLNKVQREARKERSQS